VLAAVALLTGCTSTVTGTATRGKSAAPAAVGQLSKSDMKRVMLSADEINTIMGATRIEVTSDLDRMTDSSDKVSDTDCLGAMFGAEESVYAGSGWTDVRDEVAREPDDDNDHWVEQTVVLFPEASAATRFVEKSKSSWEDCTGSSLAVDSEDSSSLWEFDDVAEKNGVISQMATQQDADGWGCQHALAAVSNLTVETWACGYAITDEAVTMADDIVAKAAPE